MLVASLAHGPTAMYGLIAVGLLPLDHVPDDLRACDPRARPADRGRLGLLIWAIAGGALVIVQGKLADQFGIQQSFLLTAACELFVLYYALWGSRSTAAMAPEQLRPDAA